MNTIAGASSLNGRQLPPPSPSEAAAHEPPRLYSRDAASSRNRIPPTGKISISSSHTTSTSSSKSQSSATSTRSPVINGAPERHPQHMRHASKARSQAPNGPFTPSPASSPMSPGASNSFIENSRGLADHSTLVRRGASHRQPNISPSGNLHHSSNHTSTTSTTSTLVADKDFLDAPLGTTQKRLDRTQSVRHRHEHSRHRSNSRSHEEQKAVGEYALHHLFNKYLPQADYKIKQCIMDRSNPADSIEIICGPGADPDFDNLLSGMAYITRRKSRALVDTIMYWRQQEHVVMGVMMQSHQILFKKDQVGMEQIHISFMLLMGANMEAFRMNHHTIPSTDPR